MYEKDNSLSNVIIYINRILMEVQPEISLDFLKCYDFIKERLFIRVSSFETNKELLKNVPHTKVEDLAITYNILMDIGDNDTGYILIRNEMMELYNVDILTLHKDSINNSPKIMPLRIAPIMNIIMGEKLSDDIHECIKKGPIDDISVYVLTNKENVNGAGVIFYDGVMDDLGKALKSGYYILPSSIHETILIPAHASDGIDYLLDMVKTVNSSTVKPEDKLTDNVYYYDIVTKHFGIAVK